MVRYSADQIREIMDNQDNIRNMSVIAHVDHGKTTLTDSLIAKAGLIDESIAGSVRFTDNRPDEIARGITIKSTSVSLCYNLEELSANPFLINLIDSPGHVDFSSEVTAALRVTDGALVVVDCVEGVCVQTETVLRQALQEKIKPVLMINKVDRHLLELQYDPETMYQNFMRTIEKVNSIIAIYDDGSMGDIMIDPTKGNCAFGSGLMGWAFTLRSFAKIYANKFGIDSGKMMKKLWGEWYFDKEAKKWKQNPIADNGMKLERAFNTLILEPIQRLAKSVMANKEESINKILSHLNIELKQEDRELREKKLLKKIMQKWINAADCLLEMIIFHMPSPKVAQPYRVQCLYEGPLDDDCAQAIRNCDPNGPLMFYVSKLVPSTDKSRFISFGRVFSGRIATGQKVRIMGPQYTPGSKEDLYIKNIQRTVIMMGRQVEPIGDIPCGNLAGLVGIDQFLQKTGTLSDNEEAHMFKNMKYSVSPIVRVAVMPKNPAEIGKLVEGLLRLSKGDSLVQCITEETGEHVIIGCGELHVEICLKDLQELSGIEIISSNPVVTYKETILGTSSQVCLSKSSNKLNRLWASAEPLSQGLPEAIETGKVSSLIEPKQRSQILMNQFGWDANDTKRIWCFGPETTGPNVLVDQTKGLQYLNETRDSIEAGFQWAVKEGILCGEQVRGVKINIVDAMLHSDPSHRGNRQITPTARAVCVASFLTANPTLQEPVFLVEVQCPYDVIGNVYQCLTARRGIVQAEEPVSGTNMVVVKAYMPVAESFGFSSHLRSVTSGQAFPQSVFDHWATVSGSPFERESNLGEIIRSIRTRKGMNENIPSLDNFLDRL